MLQEMFCNIIHQHVQSNRSDNKLIITSAYSHYCSLGMKLQFYVLLLSDLAGFLSLRFSFPQRKEFFQNCFTTRNLNGIGIHVWVC